MTLVTTNVKATFLNPDGTPIVGAKVTATLSRSEVDGSVLVPSKCTGNTDSTGTVTLPLWPNTRGSFGSKYSLYAVVGSATIWSGSIVVPESVTVVDAVTILQAAPIPSLDAAQLAVLQAQDYAAQAAASAQEAAESAALGGGGGGVDINTIKDVSNGVVGLTLFKINLFNSLGSIKSFISSLATSPRNYIFPDKDITVAGLSDITGINSGTNTGDETTSTIKTKLGITTLSGDNTGDESTASIKSKLGITTLSGSNTGDQTLTSLGIPNVENKNSTTIRSELTSANVTSALGFTPLSSSSTTDAITEGVTNQYFTVSRVLNSVLTGLSTATNSVITTADTILTAFGKLQKQITDALASLATHVADVANPHAVTKTQVGLGSVDNTSDADKPVSTAQATALGLKANQSSLTSHTGDTANPHSTTKAQVGLGNVDNTADTAKPVSTAQQTALDLKANLTSNTFSGAQIYADQVISRGMQKDMGHVFVDKGNSGTTTQTLDYADGSHQKITATGNHTIATSNWPPTGNTGYLQLDLVNGNAFTVTWPTINWEKPDGTFTTSIATYLAANGTRTALQTSGTDTFVFWSRDAGATIYGKLV